MSWTLAPKARADLFAIWDYTHDRWGAAQADRYISDIHSAIGDVASGARPPRDRSDVRRGYVEAKAGSHIIFLTRQGGHWLVVRVLHERMDLDRHLR